MDIIDIKILPAKSNAYNLSPTRRCALVSSGLYGRCPIGGMRWNAGVAGAAAAILSASRYGDMDQAFPAPEHPLRHDLRLIPEHKMRQPNALPDATSDPLGALEGNCATRVRDALLTAGVKLGLISLNSPFPGDLAAGLRSLPHAVVNVPKGTNIR